MWPIQLAFLLFIICRMFLSSLTLCNTSLRTRSVQLISILLQHCISNLCRVSDPLSEVSEMQNAYCNTVRPHKKYNICYKYTHVSERVRYDFWQIYYFKEILMKCTRECTKCEFCVWTLKITGQIRFRCALFCVITQHVVVIPCRRFGKTCRSHLQLSWSLYMGPICCPETSLRNCYSTLRNNREGRISHPHRGGSLKSRNNQLQIPKCVSLLRYACISLFYWMILFWEG
jgi:hypothetical protein